MQQSICVQFAGQNHLLTKRATYFSFDIFQSLKNMQQALVFLCSMKRKIHCVWTQFCVTSSPGLPLLKQAHCLGFQTFSGTTGYKKKGNRFQYALHWTHSGARQTKTKCITSIFLYSFVLVCFTLINFVISRIYFSQSTKLTQLQISVKTCCCHSHVRF